MLLSAVEHRLCGLNLVIGARRRWFNVKRVQFGYGLNYLIDIANAIIVAPSDESPCYLHMSF
jgi:hypothetical protein